MDAGKKATESLLELPEYNHWQRIHKDRWNRFVDFFAEVGPAPSKESVLVPLDVEKPVGPRNAMWGRKRVLMTNIELDSFRNLSTMIDHLKELGALHQAAYEAKKDPTSLTIHLTNLEKKSQPWEDKWEQQLANEKEQTQEGQCEYARKQSTLNQKGRMNQTEVGRVFMNQLVPLVVLCLENAIKDTNEKFEKYGSAKDGAFYVNILPRIIDRVELATLAHIGCTIMLNSVGRKGSLKTTLADLETNIGNKVEHEHLWQTLKDENKDKFQLIEERYLKDPVRRYDKKIGATTYVLNKDDTFRYTGFGPTEKAVIGGWISTAINTVCDWFEVIKKMNSDGNLTQYIGLSEEGIKHADLIDAGAMSSQFMIWPMVHPPLPWGEDERGGFIQYHSAEGASTFIHGDRGTKVGRETYDATKRLSNTPYRINKVIYEIQKELISSTNTIGSFRSYEKDSWWDENRPAIDPKVYELPKSHPDRKKADKSLTEAYHEQVVADKLKMTPIRMLEMAARFYHQPKIYFPVFLDARGRMYYMVED